MFGKADPPVTLLLALLAAAELASHLAPAPVEMLPPRSAPSSLSFPTFYLQHTCLDTFSWLGRGAVECVHLLLQEVQATVSSIASRAEGNITTFPAGREVYAEGMNARLFAAVTAWDHSHRMCWD